MDNYADLINRLRYEGDMLSLSAADAIDTLTIELAGMRGAANSYRMAYKKNSGKWERTRDGHYECSVCHGEHNDPTHGIWHEVFDYRYNYCPLCGARMGE